MKVRHLSLLALVAPTLALVPTTGPAAATRVDQPAAAYAVDEWNDGNAPLPAQPYAAVEVTYDATYGITLDGAVATVVPWYNDQTLVAPAFERPIVDVTGGTHFGMALDDEGHLRQWGSAPLTVPDEDLAATYRDVSATEVGAVGVTTDGDLRYWGAAAGRYAFDPADLEGTDVVSIDVDAWDAVAITSDGRVLSGGGPITGGWAPQWDFPADRADDTFVAADAGYEFAVALTDDGEVVAWGVDHGGETIVPAFPEGRHAVAVSAGLWMAAAVLDDGSVVSWGSPERTQIPAPRAGVPVADIDLDRYRVAVTYATLVPGPVDLSGTPTVGAPITADVDWSSEPDTLAFSWKVDGSEVGTAASYTPAPADADGELTVTVTATRAGFAAGTATSAGVTVEPRGFTTPHEVTVTGETRVGQVLTASVVDSVPAADSYEITWWRLRWEGSSIILAPVAGETGRTYRVRAADVGGWLMADVTAVKEGYLGPTDSDQTSAVVPGALGAPSVRISGTPRAGRPLTAVVSADPAAGASSYQWLRRGTTIPGATRASYTPVAGDLGRSLSVRVTSTAAGYDPATATSAATAEVGLGPATLRLVLPAKAKVGSTATIKVTGLAGGERFTVTVAGKRLSGTAAGSGVGTVKLPVSGKPGTRTVTVVGSLPDRKGSASLRVVKG